MLDLIDTTFSTKNVRNLLQSSVVKHNGVEGCGDTMLLIVLNRILGFRLEVLIKPAK